MHDQAETLRELVATVGKQESYHGHGIRITDEKCQDLIIRPIIRLHGNKVGQLGNDLLSVEARHIIESSLEDCFARVRVEMGGEK